MGLKDRFNGDLLTGADAADEGDVIDRAGGSYGIGYFKRKLLEEVDLAELVKLGPSQRRARLESLVADLLSREGPVLASTARSTLIRQIVDESLGLGVLEPLLADETITEIMVNGPNEVWVERHGTLHRIDARFSGEAELMQTIDRIVSTVNRRVDESSPMVDARLPSGERVNVIIPPLSLVGPVLSIRRFPRAFSFEQLVRMGSVDPDTADLLRSFVRARMSIVVSGGTSSGKTTLLNALSGFIPAEERIVTIEDSAELQLQQPHVISLEARPPNVEGKGQVTIRDLVRNSLRMRPDRIVVGEVRGPETIDMLQAMNTGHDGSLTTVHANSAEDSIVRMQTLASMSEVDIPFIALRDQINSAIDVIVQIERGADGRRRLVEVAAVSSRLREDFRLATIMRFEPDPIGADRLVTGTWVHYPLPDTVAERLRIAALLVTVPLAGCGGKPLGVEAPALLSGRQADPQRRPVTDRAALRGEGGQIIPPLLVILLLCLAFGLMMLQVGLAADYKSRSQTAADAAALGGAIEVKREIIAAWAMDHQLQPEEINMALVCAQAALYAARNRATLDSGGCSHEQYDIKVQVHGTDQLDAVGDTKQLEGDKAAAKARATPWGFGGAGGILGGGGGNLPIGGGGGGTLMGANPRLQVYADAAAKFGLRVISGLRPGAITNSGNVSWHSSGNALDLAAPMTPEGKLAMLKFAQYAAETWGSQLEELIHTPLGYGVKNGARVPPYATADHFDHVHIADTDPAAPGDESGPPTNGGAGPGPNPGGFGGGLGGLVGLKVHLVRWDGQGGRIPDIPGAPDDIPANLRQMFYNLMICESSGNPRALEEPGGNGGALGHYGLFQFDYPTWQSVGGHGDPRDASPEEQWMRAYALYRTRGWQPWECATDDNLLNYA